MDAPPSAALSPSQRTQSTNASAAIRSRRSSAYDKAFRQHLIDHDIFPEGHEHADGLLGPEPSNLDSVHEELLARRASLSVSSFPQSAFREFKQGNNRATFENDVMAAVIPILCGDSSIPSKQHVLFTELEPITHEGGAVKPKPDFFDGTLLRDLSEAVRNDEGLRSKIIPTKHSSVPVAMNFYLEAKGPHGDASVAQMQACYVGAYGARAMHAMQNYGVTEPVYDGNAYTYSSTYHPTTGTLQIYAHHVTPPTTASHRPGYHMTQLRAFALTSDRETFIAGVTAFRNVRDLAKRHRDSFIQAANARALGVALAAQDDVGGANDHEDD